MGGRAGAPRRAQLASTVGVQTGQDPLGIVSCFVHR